MINQIFNSNTSGQFKVIEQVGKGWKVQFLETGYEVVHKASRINLGTIKDPYFPSVYGKGFVGEGDYPSRIKDVNGKSYPSPLRVIWAAMIRRCYDPQFHIKYPTYSECEVCEEWLNFQSFCSSIQTLPGYNLWKSASVGELDEVYELDKDARITGNKLYSPSTCSFITKLENTLLARKNTR